MKIITCTSPGRFDVLTAERPQATPGHSVVQVRRVGICGTDIHAFGGRQPYFTYPRVLGHELGCTFVEGDAPGFLPGEHVTIIPYFHCGRCIACRTGKTNCCQYLQVAGVHTDGGMCEYISVPSYTLVHGRGLGLETLALIEPLCVSAHGIGRAAVQPGEFVLVVGAGPIGLGAMLFAQLAGGKVIAVDVNERRLAFCRDHLHVQATLSAHLPDLTQQIHDLTNGDMPTVVIDATGNRAAINKAFGFMAHTARYVLIGLQKGDVCVSHPEFHKREATLMSSRNATRADFEYVIDGIEKGLVKPQSLITHRLPFDRVTADFDAITQSGDTIKAIISLD